MADDPQDDGFSTSDDVIRIPASFEIERRNPLTTRMYEKLFASVTDAAMQTDLDLYREMIGAGSRPTSDDAIYRIVQPRQRFVITSIRRGSIVIEGVVSLSVLWAAKNFIVPGWASSETKRQWDAAVSKAIDRSATVLADNSEARSSLS